MLPLSLFRSTAKGYVDFLQPAALIHDNVMLCKSGALLASYAYRGDDMESSTPAELNALTERMNQVFRRFGSGWVSWVDCVRSEETAYLDGESQFSSPVTEKIDHIRRAHFEAKGSVYSTRYFFSVMWLPPLTANKKIAQMFYTIDGGDGDDDGTIADQNLRYFLQQLDGIEDRLASIVQLDRLGSYHRAGFGEQKFHALLQYVHFCSTGNLHPIQLPDTPMYLDSVIGGADFVTGVTPKVGANYIGVVAIDGFPLASHPLLCHGLDELDFEYRFSHRYIFLDAIEAVSESDKYRKKWAQKMRSWVDTLTQNPNGRINRDAQLMTDDADDIASDVQSGLTVFGYYTAVMVVLNENRSAVEAQCRELARVVNNIGFSARIETVNAVEAFLGSIPGHADYNVRRPLMSGQNVADFLPLASAWTGSRYNPCSLMPQGSPSLMQCEVPGSSQFRFNIHVGDVGHTEVIGPTNSGKSVLLRAMEAAWDRYLESQIYVFDKGYSAYTMCQAVKGLHYDLGADGNGLSFCPLAEIDTPSDRAWAVQWIEELCVLQGVAVTTTKRKLIREAIDRLAASASPNRTLTEFRTELQDLELREAIDYYTITGQTQEMFEASAVGYRLDVSAYTVFELEQLLELGERVVLPVLTYLFRVIDKSLDGRPTLLVLDEAWLMLGHEAFREKISEWLRTLRKNNAAVVMATQSIAEIEKSGIAHAINDACSTKIMLPNPNARDSANIKLYRDLVQLNDTQIDLVAQATPRREYYMTSPTGRRLFSLALSDFELAIYGTAGNKHYRMLRAFIQEQGEEEWLQEWVDQRLYAAHSH